MGGFATSMNKVCFRLIQFVTIFVATFISPSWLVARKEDLLALLWESSAPSKVQIFSWLIILGRLPARSNLGLWELFGGICRPPLHFVWVFLEVEDHLFIKRVFSFDIFKWLGFQSLLSEELFTLLQMFSFFAKGIKGVLLVWPTTL